MRNRPGSITYSSFGIPNGSVGNRMVSRPGEGRADRQGRELWRPLAPDSFLLPRPLQAQPKLERSHLSYPGHTEASKGHCAVGLWLLESYSALYPSARHMGSEGALSCPVLSPRAWASSPGYVPGKRIWMESWSLLPKSCPLKQSQAF